MKKTRYSLSYKILKECIRSAQSVVSSFCVEAKALRQHIIDVIVDHSYDKRLGIETSLEPKEGSFRQDMSCNKDMCFYGPTPYRALKLIFSHVRIGPEDIFMDIGCGKGRVVFFASVYTVAQKAIGMEVSDSLVITARDNQRKCIGSHAKIEIIQADAARADMSEGTVFFLFNPFGYRTTMEVIKHLRESYFSRPRAMRIIYHCPAYRFLLDDEKWLEVEKELDNGVFVIWRSIKREQ